MTEPTFPLTFTGPWNEWQHITSDGTAIRIRQLRMGGCAGGTWNTFFKEYERLPSPPLTTHYAVSVNGCRVDGFPTFKAALRKAKALANG